MYTNGQYLEHNPTWHAEDAAWKANHIYRLLRQNMIEPDSISEIGCGSGEILSCLYPYFDNSQFDGYEISPQAFELCKTKQKERLKFFLGDLLKINEVQYDLLLCIDVFEHVENYMDFLQNLHKKSKYFVFHVPLDISVLSVLRNKPLLEARSKVGHLHYFTKETALSTIEHTGYKIIDNFYTARALELKPQSFNTSLANLPRHLFYHINPDFVVRFLGGYSIMVLAESNLS
jgi:hypothetical protein